MLWINGRLHSFRRQHQQWMPLIKQWQFWGIPPSVSLCAVRPTNPAATSALMATFTFTALSIRFNVLMQRASTFICCALVTLLLLSDQPMAIGKINALLNLLAHAGLSSHCFCCCCWICFGGGGGHFCCWKRISLRKASIIRLSPSFILFFLFICLLALFRCIVVQDITLASLSAALLSPDHSTTAHRHGQAAGFTFNLCPLWWPLGSGTERVV